MARRTSLTFFIALAGAVWLVYLGLVYVEFPTWSERGQFGDAFGALNALFSGFAFAAIFVTLLLQGRQLLKQDEQLALQREDLRLQREQMAASTAELASQARAQVALAEAAAAQANSAAMATRLTILNNLVSLIHFDVELQALLVRIYDNDLSFERNPQDGYCVISALNGKEVVTVQVERLLNQLQLIGHLRDSGALQDSDLRSIRFEVIMTGRSPTIRDYLRFLITDYQATSALPHDHFKSFKNLYLLLEQDTDYKNLFQDCVASALP